MEKALANCFHRVEKPLVFLSPTSVYQLCDLAIESYPRQLRCVLPTRSRHLLALGVDPETVHMATRSRKGYWWMSQNEIVRFALNNRWLEEQGVPDLNAPAAVAALQNAKPPRMDGGTESKPYAGWCGTGELTTPRDPILPNIYR